MTQRAKDAALPQLLIATRNPGKMQEYRQLLCDAPFVLVSLDDLGITDEVEETGDTFEENAVLKARTYGALGGILTLADDSGLEVDALGGEPGVFSSRYGEKSPLTPLYERGGQGGLHERGERSVPPIAQMSDQDRVALLLRNLVGVPWVRRTARFRCVLAIVTPPGHSSTKDASIGAHFVKEIPPSPPLRKGGIKEPPFVVKEEILEPSFVKEEILEPPFVVKEEILEPPFIVKEEILEPPFVVKEELLEPPFVVKEEILEPPFVKEDILAPPFVKGGWGDLVTLVVGSVAGMIQYESQGDEGFGYDPVFYLPSYGKTMGQLPLIEKNHISHRADAARKAVKELQAISSLAPES